ncbi:MAG: hypothetical protein WAN61_02785 [Minisyncoccia bacterium]
MRKVKILLSLGIWVAILPYLGFPDSWKNILFTLTGLGLIFLSYLLYQDYTTKIANKVFDSFKENVEEMIGKI